MKFGKSIGTQQEGHADLHYVEYKLLKKKIKDVVARLQSSELAEALTANKAFEEELAAEIVKVNQCFSMRQQQLLERTAKLSEELQARQLDSGRSCPAGGSASATRADALRQLVDILQEVDQLRKYAVWNAVGVVKILKKRRKQTSFGIEDSAAERAGWLSRQSFFSGSDFAELHASIESLGHMMVLSEVLPEGGHEGGRLRSQSHQELQQCPICLDTITDMVELSCQHRFCWKCFVLGPIAFQPGEYRITQCPICRRETSQNEDGDEEGNIARTAPLEDAACMTHGTPQPSQEGLLTRFLHTYFPDKAADGDKADINTLEVEEEDVGELVKVLLADCNLQRPSGSSGCGDAAVSSDFFDTLPQPMRQDKPLRAAQKLQWLQLASSGDPFALDDNMYCSLCSEPLMMEAVVTTPCKHHFHRVCIKRIDSPQCPLCSTALPFSWFLPADHPCAEHGFRTVSPESYQPCFAGGPSKGSCGYPLQRPPPAQLYGANGGMRSYLHRLIPTGSGVESHEDEDNSPNHALQASNHAKMEDLQEDDESSESDSNSEEEVQEAEPFKRHSRHGSKPPAVYLYSAVGRMKKLSGHGRGPSEPLPVRQKVTPVTPENSPPEMARSRTTTEAANGSDDFRAPKVQLFTALFGEDQR